MRAHKALERKRPLEGPPRFLVVEVFVVLVCAVFAAGNFPSTASAEAVAAEQAFQQAPGGSWVDTSVEAENSREVVEDALYRLSGQASPYPSTAVTATDGSTVTGTSVDAAAEAVSTPISSTAGTDGILGDVVAGTVDTASSAGLIPLMSLPTVVLGTAAFGTGYLIGTQVRRFIGLEAPGGNSSQYGLIDQRVVGIRKGQPAPIVENWTAPTDGELYEFMFNDGGQLRSGVESPGRSCGQYWPPPLSAPGWQYIETTTGTCYNGKGTYSIGVSFRPGGLRRLGFHAYAPNSDPSPLFTVLPPPPPDPQTAMAKIGTVITDGHHANLDQWLDHQLEPRCHADPTSSSVSVPSILPGETPTDYQQCLSQLGLQGSGTTLTHTDLDQPDGDVVFTAPDEGTKVQPGTQVTVYSNPTKPDMQPDEQCRPSDTPPAGDPGAAPPGYTGSDPLFQDYGDSPYAGVDARNSPPSSLPIHLYWGDLRPAGTTKGWGYRHVAAEHGYGATDEVQTKAALAGTLSYQENASTWIFDYPYTGQSQGGTVSCRRRVIVQYAQRSYEPAPRHIITSYYGAPLP